MEQPMFYQGQRVVCVTRNKCVTTIGKDNPLIEGKSYYVQDPNFHHWASTKITITVCGIRGAFHQTQFVPYDTDNQLEEQIHEALKGNKILAD